MVATELNRLPSFKNRRTLSPREMKPRERKSKREQNLSSDRGPYLQQWAGYRDKKLLGYRPREKPTNIREQITLDRSGNGYEGTFTAIRPALAAESADVYVADLECNHGRRCGVNGFRRIA